MNITIEFEIKEPVKVVKNENGTTTYFFEYDGFEMNTTRVDKEIRPEVIGIFHFFPDVELDGPRYLWPIRVLDT